MTRQTNIKYIHGTAAVQMAHLSSVEGESTVIEFPRNQRVRRSAHQALRESLGEQHYANLKGTETTLSKMQLTLGGAIFFLCGVAAIFLETLI